MTKDEFLDVMGGIDERLIDSTLDISRMETVIVPYKRPPVLKYILCAAACAAMIFAVAGGVRYFNGKALLPNSGNSESSDSSVADSTDGSKVSGESTVNSSVNNVTGWNPEDILDSERHVGSSAVISTAELDGISVSLIMHNITKLPGEPYSANGYDYTDYYGAEDIVLYAKDDKGRKLLEDYVTPHNSAGVNFLHKDCLFDGSTRLYKSRQNGEEYYVLMQYSDYNKENDAFIAGFYNVDLDMYTDNRIKDENGILRCGLECYRISGPKRIGSWWAGYPASKSFGYKEGAVFADPEYGYEITIGAPAKARVIYPADMPDGYEELDPDNITGWDPEKLEYNPYPEVGESAVVSTDTVDGITVSLIMYNVVKRPGESDYRYTEECYPNMWVAENICLYIKDGEGRRVMGYLPSILYTDNARILPKECLFDGCTRLFGTEQGGETHYLIMQYIDHDVESDSTQAVFIDCDMELYTANVSVDENGIAIGGGLRPIGVTGSESLIGSFEYCRVSKGFEHTKGTTFIDPEYGYVVTFDFKNHSAKAVRYQPEGWNPEELNYGEPRIGGDAILSSASLDGIDVTLIAHNITHLPGDEIDGQNHTKVCAGNLCAERVLLYLKDSEGRRVLSTQINSLVTTAHHRIPEECLFDGCTRIYEVEQDGETYYLLMQYAEYDEEKDALLATFYILDMELYDAESPKDENGISGGGLWFITISDPAEKRIGGWWQAYQASKGFEYKDGTTFADPEYGYEITFDMKKGTAKVVYPSE